MMLPDVMAQDPTKNLANDDASDLLHTSIDGDDAANLEASLKARFSQPDQKPAPTEEAVEASALEKGKSIAKDVGRGILEVPQQAWNGVVDAVDSTLNVATDLENWLASKSNILGSAVVYDHASGIKILSGEERKAQGIELKGPSLDALKGKEASSVTGNLVHDTAEFLTGFVGAGKALKGLQVASRAGMYGKILVQGGLADFAAFEGDRKRISDLIESYPSLKNPITGMLASDPSDSKLAGRFKNAVEGMGLGLAADGLFKGLSVYRERAKATAKARLAEQSAGQAIEPIKEITLDDLKVLGDFEGKIISNEANPADLLKNPEAPAKQTINFARIDSPEDVQKAMQQAANLDSAAINEAKRGVQTHEQTIELAKQENAWQIIMSRRQGEPLNAEQSVAARNLWVSSANKLTELAKLAEEIPSEANLYAFRRMFSVHAAIQKEVMAARTETARALNSWKIVAGGNADNAKQIEALISSSGGLVQNQKLASMISKMAQGGEWEAIAKTVDGSFAKKSADAFRQAWTGGLLSNPPSWAANFSGGFLTTALTAYERLNAAFISQAIGEGSEVQFREVLDYAVGAVESYKDALKLAAKTFKTGESSFGLQGMRSLEGAQTGGALSPDVWNVAQGPFGSALKVLDTATIAPGRIMGAGDEFHKSVNYAAQLNMLANRKVRDELAAGTITREQMGERLQFWKENPSEEMVLDSNNMAFLNTFNSKPPELLDNLATSLQNIPVIGRMVLPFKNTPINIAAFAFERTPLAPLSSKFKADLAAGGTRAMVAQSKVATGTMIMMTAMDYALAGKITGGGPEDPNERALWLREGNQPYSIKVGNKWVSYNRLDPLAMTVGVGADISEAIMRAGNEVDDSEFQKVFAATIFSIAENVMSRSYMQGAANLVGAIENPDLKASGYLNSLAGSLIPAISGNAAKINDPYMREARNMVDAMRRKIPGLGAGLPYKRDIWGRKINMTSKMGPAWELVSPISVRTNDPEPIDTELRRLSFFPQMPSRTMSVDRVQIDLDPKEYSRYVQLAGNEYKDLAFGTGLKDTLNDIVSGTHPLSPMYQLYGDDQKKEYVEQTIRRFRERAARALVEENPSVAAKVEFEKQTKLNEMMNLGR